MSSTPQRVWKKLIESKEGEKREMGATTFSHTVLMCVQHKRFQLHQKTRPAFEKSYLQFRRYGARTLRRPRPLRFCPIQSTFKFLVN